MTKTMKINELISELIGFGGESTVKVWSKGADKAYPISHVGQGYTDGVLDTYVSIVVDDDRNLVDLSKIWHDASEIPEEYPILCLDKFGDLLIYEYGYPECVEFNDISKWAYVSDILPKGGKK